MLRFVPSNLLVPVLGGGTLLEVQTLQEGILAEFLFDGQCCFLEAPFFVKSGLFRPVPFLLGFGVFEQV